MKLFRTASPAVIKCCQLAYNILPVQSQVGIRRPTAKILQLFIASENSSCYLFSSTARRQLNELFAQFDNVVTACQLLDSFTYFIDSNTDLS